MQPEELAKNLSSLVKDYVGKAVTAVTERLSALEERSKVLIDKEGLEKALSSLPTPKDGEDGKPGKDGESVDKSVVREMVQEMVDDAFSKIKMPQDGKDGEDGRNAVDIEIRPEIDIEKSYPRGTYAKHLGGLWKSYEKTHGMKGWECIVEGVQSFEVEYDDERTITIKSVSSTGSTVEKSFKMPAMVYKNVFREGGEYQKGDTVTFAGSLWHCNQDTNERPGTGSKDWSLAAKRGSNGKDKS